MKLNGWQRLWVVLTSLWLAFVIYRLLVWSVIKGRGLDLGEDWGVLIFALLAPFGIYVIALVVRRTALWILGGFRGT